MLYRDKEVFFKVNSLTAESVPSLRSHTKKNLAVPTTTIASTLDLRVSRLVHPTSYAVIHKLLKGTHTVVPTYNHAFEGCSTTAYKGQRGDTSRSAKLPNWQSSSESQRRATSGQGFLPSDMHKIWSG